MHGVQLFLLASLTATLGEASSNLPPTVCRSAFPAYPNASVWTSSMQPTIRIQMGPCLGCACVLGGAHGAYATALCGPLMSTNVTYDGCLGAVGACQDEVRFSLDCQNVTITKANHTNNAAQDPIDVLGTVWYRVAQWSGE